MPLALSDRQDKTARLVLKTLAEQAQPGPDPGTLIASIGQRLLASRCGMFHGTLADALAHLIDAGAITRLPTGPRERDVYRLTFWEWFDAERAPAAALAAAPAPALVGALVAAPADRGTVSVSVTGTRTGGGRARAAVAGPLPALDGPADPTPSPSTSTTDTTADPDRGCPDHGWADPGRPCGGCADARKRRDAAQRDAEQAQRDAEQAQRDAYAAAVADAGPCEHGEPGGDVMRPGNRGPACEPCRLAWRESISRVPADRRRAAEPDQLDAEPTGPPADVADRLAVLLAGGRP